jgi:hypothetical protein
MVQRAAVKKPSNIRFLLGPKQCTVPKALDLPSPQPIPGEPLRVSFKVEPVYLSPEHARQVERFTGLPYDPEGDARIKAWVAFKNWHHRLQLADEARRTKSARPKPTSWKAESPLMSTEVIPLATRSRERDEQTFVLAVERLDSYVARRVARGERVAVVKPPYRKGQTRAVLSVDGARVRVFYMQERGAWRAA